MFMKIGSVLVLFLCALPALAHVSASPDAVHFFEHGMWALVVVALLWGLRPVVGWAARRIRSR